MPAAQVKGLKKRRFKQPRHVREAARERQRKWRLRKKLQRDRLAAKTATLPLPATDKVSYEVEDFTDWAGKRLKVPSGRLQSKPFLVEGWQADFLRGALADDVMEAGLSVARKNGKSGLIAAVLLCYMAGPWKRRGWRGIVCSLTGRLSGELLTAMRTIAEASGITGITFKRTPYPGQASVGEDDIVLDFLAADKAAGHAMGADIAIIDEAGLLEERQRPLWNAMLSSVSGRDGRLVCISIRGDSPMFEELIARKDEPEVHVTEFAAPKESELDDPEVWKAANPGLGTIKSADYMRKAAKRALATPADQSAFRAHDLNQPNQPERVMIISVSDWDKCVTSNPPPRSGPCCLGVDLGGSTSMTCAVAYWPVTGRFECWGAFPDNPSLQLRGEADAVGSLYVQMASNCELVTYPGRVTNVARFLQEAALSLQGEEVRMAADRYRRAEAMEALDKAGVRWPVEWRGQGASHTADGSRDVRSFQRLTLSGKWRGHRSLMMEQAIAQSSLAFDHSGNAKLVRAKSTGRIDALQAGVLAAGLGERVLSRPVARPRYRGLA